MVLQKKFLKDPIATSVVDMKTFNENLDKLFTNYFTKKIRQFWNDSKAYSAAMSEKSEYSDVEKAFGVYIKGIHEKILINKDELENYVKSALDRVIYRNTEIVVQYFDYKQDPVVMLYNLANIAITGLFDQQIT